MENSLRLGIGGRAGMMAAAAALAAAPQYFPGQDYPDREKWLAKRYTPITGLPGYMYFDSRRWGTFNAGVNHLKRQVRAEAAAFIKAGKPLALEMPDGRVVFVQHTKCLPKRAQLLELRRKAQRQGHVTIEPDAASRARIEAKRGQR